MAHCLEICLIFKILASNQTIYIKFTLEQATKAQRGSRSIALVFLQPRSYFEMVANAAPRPLYLREEARYSLYRRLGCHRGPSGRVRKISPQRDLIPSPSSPTTLSRPMTDGSTTVMGTLMAWLFVHYLSIITLVHKCRKI